jgi:predicted amidohydrolase YtcJ
MLIRNAELEDGTIADLRLRDGRIAEIGRLDRSENEPGLDANGGLLIPGLHDHHLHLMALAASFESLRCGPPEVTDVQGFAQCLRQAPGSGWLRGTGYHESLCGLLDAAMLDAIVRERPLRIQHRSGRMWFLNSMALDRLLSAAPAPPGLERIDGRYTGRLFDSDTWLKQALRSEPPALDRVGRELEAVGITGVTDMSPRNDAFMAAHFAAQRASGALPQRLLLAGLPELAGLALAPGIRLGAVKLHLHEAEFAPLDEAAALIRLAHEQGRPIAIHCATEAELAYAIAAIDEAGTLRGDRIEHASVASDAFVDEIARRDLAVVSQPHFVSERGDEYRALIDAAELPQLYRLRSFLNAGVALAAGSDSAFGHWDPWASMAAAVSRRTRSGHLIGECESLTPEQALDCYLRDPEALDRRRRVEVGGVADLCLLDRGWARARTNLHHGLVSATLIGGKLSHSLHSMA